MTSFGAGRDDAAFGPATRRHLAALAPRTAFDHGGGDPLLDQLGTTAALQATLHSLNHVGLHSTHVVAHLGEAERLEQSYKLFVLHPQLPGDFVYSHLTHRCCFRLSHLSQQQPPSRLLTLLYRARRQTSPNN